MNKLDGRGFRLGFAALALFTGLAGDFWRNLLSWYGFGVIVVLLLAGAIVLLVRGRRRVNLGRMPYPLIVFLMLTTASIAWSFYPGSSALGVSLQWITTAVALPVALMLSWSELLRVLGWVLRSILALSFLFEFVVSAFIRHPVFPVWVTPDDPNNVAKLLYWSRDLLFSGGKIQGIVGNSSLLAMIALIALIVFAIQLACRSVGTWGWFWLVVAATTIGITRSATIYIALVVVVVLAGAALLLRRATTGRGIAYGVIAASLVVIGTAGFLLRGPLLHLMGKSTELTGRIDIWNAVIHLAQQRPGFGWGWVSYWTPWVEPFKSLIVKGGVQVMHAHNAWLDVWLQLGILGLIVFGALVLATLVRSWLMATDPIITAPGSRGHYSWVGMLPLLVLGAQLVQSIAESRILVEGGWILLVLFAVKTKLAPLSAELEGTPEAVEALGRGSTGQSR